MKNKAVPIIGFDGLKTYPGEAGNIIDIFLHKAERLEDIPGALFAVMLLVLAALPTFGRWYDTAGLWGFFLLDWLLLAMLPKAGKSYGPPKPPVVFLAVARCLAALLPLAASLPLQIIGTILVIYGFWIEPHRLKVTYQKLTSPKLHNSTPLRVLHLGDLHIERVTNREITLNKWIEGLHPDLILFSGDILNLSYLKDQRAWQDARAVMSAWKAPLGVFAVSGSSAVDLSDNMPELIDGLPIRWLKDEKIEINFGEDCLNLLGITCNHRPYLDGPRLNKLMEQTDGHFNLLLYHSPDLAAYAANAGLDLQLSGHTHGGQVRLPLYGAIFAGSLYDKKFESGRYQLADMTLYVSRGIGMEGCAAPRVRFLCPPEIILWEISGEQSAQTKLA
ncbi:MAG: metallophosphoesterase [Anaerolineaceae bacterium]|nr:metallophosphoesterase [Anaerolineaceae bacterium]